MTTENTPVVQRRCMACNVFLSLNNPYEYCPKCMVSDGAELGEDETRVWPQEPLGKIQSLSSLTTEQTFSYPDMAEALLIPEDVWLDLMSITKLSVNEISMMGYVERRKEGLFVTGFWVPEQKVWPAFTQITHDGMASVQNKVMERDLSLDGLRLWIHSHVNMPAQFSGHDLAQMTKWGGDFTKWDPEWFISLVINRRGEHSCLWNQFRPVRFDHTLPVLIDETYRRNKLIDLISRNCTPGGNRFRKPEEIDDQKK